MPNKIPDMIERFIANTPFALFGSLDDKAVLKNQIINSKIDLQAVDNLPLVSIIMPLFNSDSEQLEQAILSVVSQSYPNWELITVDDGSTSVSHLAVVEMFKSLFPRQVFLYKEVQNRGISEARNSAVAKSSGTYLALLDHDDILHPLAIAESMKHMQVSKVNFTYSFEVKLTNDGKDLREFLSKPKFSWFTLLHLNYICHFTVIERAFLDTVAHSEKSWFNPEYDGAEDHDLFLRCSRQEEFKPKVIPLFLYLWRMTSVSTSQDQSNKPLSRNRSISAAISNMSEGQYAGEEGSAKHPFRTHSYLRPIVSNELSEVGLVHTSNINSSSHIFKSNKQVGIVLKTMSDHKNAVDFDSRALNLRASHHISEYLLFANPNIQILNQNLISEAVEWLKRFPEIGSVGASILDVPRVPSLQSPNVDVASYPIHTAYCIRESPGIGGGYRFSSYLEKRWFAFESRSVIANTRHFLLLRRRDFWNLKGFDELRFRHNGFDLDLGLRLKNSGKMNINLGFVGIKGFALEECKLGFGEPEQVYLYDILPQSLSALQLCYNFAYNQNGLKN